MTKTSSIQSLAAATGSSNAQPQGREAYVARLKAARAKKAALSVDPSIATRENTVKAGEDHLNVANASGALHTNTAVSGKRISAEPFLASGLVQANSTISDNQPKLKVDVASRVKQRVAELKMLMASKKIGQVRPEDVLDGTELSILDPHPLRSGLAPSLTAQEVFEAPKADTDPPGAKSLPQKDPSHQPAMIGSASESLMTEPVEGHALQHIEVMSKPATAHGLPEAGHDQDLTVPGMLPNNSESGANGLDNERRGNTSPRIVTESELGGEMEVERNENETSQGLHAASSSDLITLPHQPPSPSAVRRGDFKKTPRNTAVATQTPVPPQIQDTVLTSKVRIIEQQARLAAKIFAEKAALADLERRRNAKMQPSLSTAPAAPPLEMKPTNQEPSSAPRASLPSSGSPRRATEQASKEHSAPVNGNLVNIIPAASWPAPASNGRPLPPSSLPSLTPQAFLQNSGESDNRTTAVVVAAMNPTAVAQTEVVAQDRSPAFTPSSRTRTRDDRRNETTNLLKRRRADMSELDQRLSEKRRKLEEQQRLMLQLEAEIEATDRERENLVNELEAVGIDTDGMTHEELVETKETFALSQRAACRDLKQDSQSKLSAPAALVNVDLEFPQQEKPEPSIPAELPNGGGGGVSGSTGFMFLSSIPASETNVASPAAVPTVGHHEIGGSFERPAPFQSEQEREKFVEEPFQAHGVQIASSGSGSPMSIENDSTRSSNLVREQDASPRLAVADPTRDERLVRDQEQAAYVSNAKVAFQTMSPRINLALPLEDNVGMAIRPTLNAAASLDLGLQGAVSQDAPFNSRQENPQKLLDAQRMPGFYNAATADTPMAGSRTNGPNELPVVAISQESVPMKGGEVEMTDDSMSVSSGEPPEGVESPSAMPVALDAQPPIAQPATLPPAPLANDTAPALQYHAPAGHPPIPVVPSRFYNPRDRRVLGLSDEASMSGFETSARDLPDLDLVAKVVCSPTPINTDTYQT